MKTKEHRTLLSTILSQWLPLAPATFRAIVEIVPQPAIAQKLRIPKMLHPDLPYYHGDVKPLSKLEEDLYSGSTAPSANIVAYVSKMFAMPSDILPQNQRKPLTAEEMRARGRASREAAAALAATGASIIDQSQPWDESVEDQQLLGARVDVDPVQSDSQDAVEEVLLGFARLYSGRLRTGQKLFAVLPKYDSSKSPSHVKNSKYVTVVTVGESLHDDGSGTCSSQRRSSR